MAQNALLKVRSGGWIQIHPETNLGQIIGKSTLGGNLVTLANPGADGLVVATTTGGATVMPFNTVISTIGASPYTHPHDQLDITGLVADMAAKADLSGGKIISSQIPDWMIGGLKFVDSYDLIDTPVTVNLSFRTTYGMTATSSLDKTNVGKYIIFTVNCTVSFDANHIPLTGDEGDTTGSIDVEAGDWIIFRGYDGTNYQFDIINNTYRNADEGIPGIVALSDGSATTRAGLHSSHSSLKMVDEYSLSKVLRTVYYEDAEGDCVSPQNGDILFEY